MPPRIRDTRTSPLPESSGSLGLDVVDGVVGRLSLGKMAGHDGTPDHSHALSRFVTVLQAARIEVSAAPKAAANAVLVTYTVCTRANAPPTRVANRDRWHVIVFKQLC